MCTPRNDNKYVHYATTTNLCPLFFHCLGIIRAGNHASSVHWKPTSNDNKKISLFRRPGNLNQSAIMEKRRVKTNMSQVQFPFIHVWKIALSRHRRFPSIKKRTGDRHSRCIWQKCKSSPDSCFCSRFCCIYDQYNPPTTTTSFEPAMVDLLGMFRSTVLYIRE